MKNYYKIITLVFYCILASCGGGSSNNGGVSIEVPPNIRQSPKVGSSPYAIQQATFPCDEYINSVQNLTELHISILWNTFDTGGNSCLLRAMNLPNFRSIQIHLINETCVSSNRCGSYEFLHGLTTDTYSFLLRTLEPTFISRLQDYAFGAGKFLEDNLSPGILCNISPGLESELSNEQARVNLIQSLRPIFPMCTFSMNPENSNPNQTSSGANYVELHNADAQTTPPCIANLDGEDIDFPERRTSDPMNISVGMVQNYIDRNQHCDFVYLWTREHNCLPNAGQDFIDPRSRTCVGNGVYSLIAREIEEAQRK